MKRLLRITELIIANRVMRQIVGRIVCWKRGYHIEEWGYIRKDGDEEVRCLTCNKYLGRANYN